MAALTALPSWWGQFGTLVTQYAQEYNLSPALVAAVIQQESGGSPSARSSEGANGLMQVVGGSFDPATNIQQGVTILSNDISQWGPTLGLAAYNAGGGNVGQYGWNILNPGYLISQGWSAFDANQPYDYLQAVPSLESSFQSLLGLPTTSTSGSISGSAAAPSSTPGVSAQTATTPTVTPTDKLNSLWAGIPTPNISLNNPFQGITSFASSVLSWLQMALWLLVGLVIALIGLWLLVRS